MDAKDIRTKSADELRRMEGELAGQIRDTRFKVATRQVKNLRSLRQAKKDLARVKSTLQTLSSQT